MSRHRLLEIRRELEVHHHAIETLRTEEGRLLAAVMRLPGPELRFDADGKTVRWQTASVRVSKKAWRFLETLWKSPKRRARTNRLGRYVWNDELVRDNNISVFVTRLNETLRNAGCPYEIKSIRDRRTGRRIGFRLCMNQDDFGIT